MRHAKTVFVCIMLAALGSSLQGAIPLTQRQALIALYSATGGDSWTLNTGWKTPPLHTDGFSMPGTEGTWRGITVSGDAVTVINESSNNLVGTLPASVGSLTGLTVLDLSSNSLSGSIPASIGNLTNLTLLRLSYNQLTGTLPPELWNLVNLQTLNLCSNQLSGTLPAAIGNLTALRELLLYTNLFSGSLPSEMGNLVNLRTMAMHANGFSGALPASIGSLTALQEVVLNENAFTGALPTEWGGLSALTFLRIANNQISGSIPASFGDLSNLTDLIAGNNSLSGAIPPELGGLHQLVTLDLRFNYLTGTIPAALGGMTALQVLYLQHNYNLEHASGLSGSIPPELGSLSSLRELLLHGNALTGAIPAELGNLANLQMLYLNENQLTGSIPSVLGNLHNLRNLHLHTNHLSGTIPAELAGLTQVVDLCLSGNSLEGTIPVELGNLTQLQSLQIFGNKLAGPIPLSLANLTSLVPATTDFGYNALYASDEELISFLNSKDADWASTQTVAPTGITATSLDNAVILVSWLPIAYTGDTGSYKVSISQTAGGPYTLAGETTNKTTSSVNVTGLTPGQRYYFVVQTHTNTHANNQSALDSENGTEATAIAWLQLNVHISGTITAGGSPLANVVMSGLTGSPVTNASGVYTGTEAAGWSGTVTPILAGYAFVPASRTYTSVMADLTGQDYAVTVVVSPTITVTSPNGGERWTAGSTHDVTWSQTDLTGQVTIDLYKGGVYQKTLGTADATAGTFSWVIGATETAGTDYRILVWQGSVSDDSDTDFVVVRKAKVDFNNDGQEDILWRYYGEGAYQGLNLVWLMNQTVTPELIPLGTSPTEAAGTLSGASPRVPLETGALRTATFKTLLEGMERPALESKKVMTDPMEVGRRLVLESRGVARERDLLIRKDAVDVNTTSSAKASIAALHLNSEVIFSQVPDTAWQVAGTGDFNGDGHTDILWRHYGTGGYQGLNDIWFMDGTTFLSESVFSQITDLNWRIGGTGDFNGDGQTDILWRYYGTGDYQGLNVIWYMNGSTFLGETVFSQVTDTAWQIAGTGDFNGDGQTDILWRYYGTGPYQGLNDIWFMNGTTFLGESVFSQVTDTAWEIAGTGDFNNDGQTDILWRYYGTGPYQGLNDIWYMNGTTFMSEEVFSQVPDTNWRIVNR